MYTEKIRIGTLVAGNDRTARYISEILKYGFESFSLTFWQSIGDIDLDRLADDVMQILEGSNAVISSLAVYGNPLLNDTKAEDTQKSWEKLIKYSKLFGCDIVAGFTGRIVDRPINESIDRFSEVFTPLAALACDHNVRLAFENCDMGGDWFRGDWNIAHGPVAWDMMFNSVKYDNIGLQWEPCHQMVKLIDPMPQLRKWVGKIYHVHGKDASVNWDTIKEFGVYGPKQFAFHRTPGFGDSNWMDIISELRLADFQGSIDIEGWHDPVYRDTLEMTGQVHALNYLKQCRGGKYIPNPS